MSPNAVPSKVHWQNTNWWGHAEKTAETSTLIQVSQQSASQPKPSGETIQSSQNQPSSQPHNDLKSSVRKRLHTRIGHWLEENMANLVEDALQATPQSRTKPVDKP